MMSDYLHYWSPRGGKVASNVSEGWRLTLLTCSSWARFTNIGTRSDLRYSTWTIVPRLSHIQRIDITFKTRIGKLESAKIHEIVHLNSLGELPKFSTSSSEENFHLIWIVRNDIWGRIMWNRLGQNCIKSSCTCEPSEYRLDRGSWREPATLTSLLQKPWMRNPA